MWYEVRLTPDDNDTLIVTVPAFPEITSFGDGVEFALRHGLLAIREAIAVRIANGKKVPAPVMERQAGTYYVGAFDAWSPLMCDRSFPVMPQSAVQCVPNAAPFGRTVPSSRPGTVSGRARCR